MRTTNEASVDGSAIDRSLFQPFLAPSEIVIWSGKPERVRLIGGDTRKPFVAALLCVSLAPSGLVLLAMWLGARQSSWSEVSGHWLPWVSLFALNAIFLAIFAVLAYRRTTRLKETVYALTNRRAIKLRISQAEPNSSALDLVNRFKTHIRRDGSGDLVFGYRREYVNYGEGSRWEDIPRLTFEDISDVRRVLSLAQDALAKLGYQTVS
jgi:hypothetical protein